MPTPQLRAAAICDALVNGTSTAEQRQRVLDAFGTPADFLQVIREFVLHRITESEIQAPVAQAKGVVAASVAADFQEMP